MQIKNRFIKILFRLLIVISILECIYLFAIPPILQNFLNQNYINNLVEQNSNAKIDYKNPQIKTHILPVVTLKVNNINVLDKNDNSFLFNADNLNIKLSLLKLLRKKADFKYVYADNIEANLQRYTDGTYNFQKIFPKKEQENFKIQFDNAKINVKSVKIHSIDELLNKNAEIVITPLEIIKNKKTSQINVKTAGNIISSENKSDFDINLKFTSPVNVKNWAANKVDGSCFIYNLNLKPLLPYVQLYTNNTVSDLDGFIKFLQISAKNQNNRNQIVVNSQFNNVLFNKKDWSHNIFAQGETNFNTTLELENKTVDIKSFNYKADKINIKTNGSITFNDKPELDIEAEVVNSKAENIAKLLPPDLVKEHMTIEKIRNYGVVADLNSKIKVKGQIPQPDVTGYVNAQNVKVLDEHTQKLHNGTVNIKFDKRILNMDILIDFLGNQHAKINGYVYMFRDGINNVTVKTTNNIDFPLAQKIVVPVSKVFNFQLGPIPDMNITSGKGIIDINIQGSLDYINLNGYSSFDKAKLTYNGLFGEITQGKGRIDFKEDVITVKSEKAFVKDNPLKVSGKVKINDNLDFDISSNNAETKDVLEIINKSDLLKDVKDGLVIIKQANGRAKLFVNMKAKIVPVPFGMPPLPPDEAFEDMKVNGYISLLGDKCKIEGFETPIENINGSVNFTETVVNLNKLQAEVGNSPIKIEGTIVTDVKEKIPDVDILITSNNVNLKDTIKFLTRSYLYPQNYPDLSPLYNIGSKHDLYFKYKAKSIDFITDKAYAVMNFIQDNSDNPIKAKSGKIIMEKSTVKVENVIADLFNSTLKVNGNVQKVDTINPIYNLKINTDFNLNNLNEPDKLTILPKEILDVIKEFNNFDGLMNVNLEIKKNLFNGDIKLIKPKFKHIKSNIPFDLDDFEIALEKNKIFIKNIAGTIAHIPFYGDIKLFDIYTKLYIDGFITSKLTNEFIKNYLPNQYSSKIFVTGDISTSARIKGTQDNLEIYPKLTLQSDADVIIGNVSLGEISDKREFTGDINVNKNIIKINKIDYLKYVTSQNNTIYPILFASANGILKLDNSNNLEVEKFAIKTNKSIPAKVLNIFFKQPIFHQGIVNCDLEYIFNHYTKIAKLTGDLECRNLDIPLFDTLIKNIKLKAENNEINASLFGFLNDSKINVNSVFENNLYQTPKINSLKIVADQIDNDKLLVSLAKLRKAMNTNNEVKNMDFSGVHIENGLMEIKKLIVKSMQAENFTSNFSIDKQGIFNANNLTVDLAQGNVKGDLTYNLNTSELNGDFELNNVESNYIAETLFDGKNQIYGNANGKIIISTKGLTDEEIIKNLSGIILFDISDGRMPKLGSLEYLLRASNIIKSGITALSLNNILELLNLVKTGYFSNINGACEIKNGIAQNIEIFSKGENLSLYIHGNYDIEKSNADMEILGKISKRISTVFGTLGNTSLNTFFKLIPGISMLDFSRKDFVEDVEKIPSFTNGDYESRVFQAIINGDINSSGYVQSFKWVK